MRYRVSAAIVCTLLFVPAWAARLAAEDDGEKSATFSIAAVDPETGICGAAVASKYPELSRWVT